MGRPSNALRGRVAVIMESTQGVAPLIAAALAQAGAAITLCGAEMAAVEILYQQFAAIPGVEVLGAACQGHHLAEVHIIADQTMERFGQIDIWINHPLMSGPSAPTHELAAAQVQGIVDRALLATMHGTQVALTRMLPRQRGKIITVLNKGAPSPTHDAMRVALLRFTRSVAEEYRATGLSINALTTTPGLDAVEVGERVGRLAGAESDGVTGRVYQMGQPWWQPLRQWMGQEP
ncbi:MAG: SDR family NAD(P)-dependent oxidoreductase [Ardenticatenales bacterium]|nr:SDR family NAD(P)-dependent oxidoreductase [Ardenticatenales bacterium]